MAVTDILGITELGGTQEERSVTVNEAFALLETVGLGVTAKDVMLNTPPGSPVAGDTYVIGTSPTGAWASEALNVARFYNGSWRFLPVRPGMIGYAENEDLYYRYRTGYGWEVFISPSGPSVGVEQTDFFSTFIKVAEDGDIYFTINSPIALTIVSITTRAFGGGSGTLSGDIGGTPLGGSANDIDNTEETQTHASANVVAVGADFKVTIGVDSPPPTDLAIMIKYTYELAS